MASSINASTSGAGGIITTADNTGILNIQTAGTTAVTVDASQKVGIGTTSPTTKLDVVSSATADYVRMANAGYQGYFGVENGVGGAVVYSQTAAGGNAPLAFGIGATERMRINSNGHLLIGTTTEAANETALVLSTNSGTTRWSVGPWSSVSTNFYITATSAAQGVYLSGTSATSWSSLSDERFKTDLKSIENGLEKVASLRAVTGRFKTDEEDKSRSFLIAQDIQEVLPEAVDTSNPEQLGVSYTDTIPLLVAAIKELKAIVDAQQIEINALKAK